MTNIYIISGFLGAGKTTLIQQLLEYMEDTSDTIVIENDFGNVSLDTLLLQSKKVWVESFISGCICCSLSGDFKEGLTSILKEYHPKQIIIEPSGVGKVHDIIQAIQEISRNHPLQITKVITLVDGKKGAMYLENFTDFFEDQLHQAHLLIMTRKMWEDIPMQAHQKLLFLEDTHLSFEMSKVILHPSLPLEKENDTRRCHNSHLSENNAREHTHLKHTDTCDHNHHTHATSCDHSHIHTDSCGCHHHSCEDLHKDVPETKDIFQVTTLTKLPNLPYDTWQSRINTLTTLPSIIRCKGILPGISQNYILQYTLSEQSIQPTKEAAIGIMAIGNTSDLSKLNLLLTKEIL